MIIKKHKNKNQYAYTGDLYVRDLTLYGVNPIDVNEINTESDKNLFIDNEFENYSNKLINVDSESNYHPLVVIVSDGFNFKNKHKILAKLPRDIAIIAVNGALKRWSLVGEHSEEKRAINYYVVNNPYKECMGYLPTLHRYYPKCIASSRTHPEFLRSYQGNKYIYSPVETQHFSGLDRHSEYRIDDYRNPICAALSLAYKFKAVKILLFCCDDSFEDQRPAAEKLENNLWCYPQQIISHNVIDAMCYWLKLKNINIADYSNGGKYNNATYIKSEEDIIRYFEND